MAGLDCDPTYASGNTFSGDAGVCKSQAQEVGISDKSSMKSYIECMSQHAQKVYL